jgi:DtxR family Mn-dependent transcriptional regulator
MLDTSNIMLGVKLSSKKEDYLETIYRLSTGAGTVGLTDIARERGVTLPTVNSAIGKLKEDGLVNQEHYGKIALTPAGERKAAEIYRAHKVLSRFLSEILGLSTRQAENEACIMEHGLSPMTLQRLENFINKVLAGSYPLSPETDSDGSGKTSRKTKE